MDIKDMYNLINDDEKSGGCDECDHYLPMSEGIGICMNNKSNNFDLRVVSDLVMSCKCTDAIISHDMSVLEKLEMFGRHGVDVNGHEISDV